MVLLQAVEEQDLYSTAGGAPKKSRGGAAMDWTAGAAGAGAAYGDGDADMTDEQDVDKARPRRAAAKRPRYMDDSSSIDFRSESYSVGSGGHQHQHHRSRYVSGNDTDAEADSDTHRRRKSSKPAAVAGGGAYGRYGPAPYRGLSDSYPTSSYVMGGAGAGGAAGGAAGAGGYRGSKSVRQPSPAAALQPPKKHRWVAGANQWVTDDGLTVWPKASWLKHRQNGDNMLKSCTAKCLIHY